jgi:hypothetical protein
MPKFEPVRWYGIFAAAVAVAAYYVDIPTNLFLALGAAVLLGGGAEFARHHASPTARRGGGGPADEPAG